MNGKYVKPMLFASKVSGEGVYLASGSGTVTVECVYEGNEWDMNPQYLVRFVNLPEASGEKPQQADAVLRVEGANVSSVFVQYGGTAALSGNTINLHLDYYSNDMGITLACDKLGCTVIVA